MCFFVHIRTQVVNADGHDKVISALQIPINH